MLLISNIRRGIFCQEQPLSWSPATERLLTEAHSLEPGTGPGLAREQEHLHQTLSPNFSYQLNRATAPPLKGRRVNSADLNVGVMRAGAADGVKVPHRRRPPKGVLSCVRHPSCACPITTFHTLAT